MPERILRQEVAVGTEVRHVVELAGNAWDAVRALLQPLMGRQLERPEQARETNLLRIVDRLLADDEHRIAGHCVFHGSDEIRGRLLTQIGAQHFGSEQRLQRVYLKGQSTSPRTE